MKSVLDSKNQEMSKSIFDVRMWAVASLTLGLAPFAPEPHIWGKLKWVAGGANGMKLMDWGDLAMHGAPWVMLMISIVMLVIAKSKGN